ncbi:hypothetical protein CMI38_05475 [Candidatus Pacearchaeota archaeon]|jgi:iron-sulfur cluster insertion protein|nr:hypothetical protein [Candidatus Pacearchaeota archaeon]
MGMITITDSAKQQVIDLCNEHKTDAVKLQVNGGGCSGFKYEWGFVNDAEIQKNDEVMDFNKGKLVIDGASVFYIAGTEVDYVREVFGSHFEIKNPTAKSSCGCGDSFSV